MLTRRSSLPRLSLNLFAVALVSAGIVHITSTLAIPYMGAETGYDRLAGDLPLNVMRVLPPPAPGNEALPFNDPGHRLAACHFDLGTGRLTVTATLPDRGWSLAIYSPHGDNYYAIAGGSLRSPEVTLTLEPTRATLLNLFGIGTAPNFDPSRIPAPESRGLIVIRAPHQGYAFEAKTAALLAKASCKAGSAAD